MKKYSDEDNSRTDVNGAWKPLSPLSKDFDFFMGDDAYDNVTGKTRKERRQVRRDLRQSGVSRKDARKSAKAQIPNPFKTKLTEAERKVGRAVLVTNGALVTSRGAYLALVELNFRGFAYKLNSVLQDPNLKSQLEKKWYNLGGDFDKLVKAIQVGYKKDPFVCGKKCQAKELMDKKSFDGEFSNFVLLGVTITGAMLVTFASACITALAGIISSAILNNTEKKKIESAERIAKQEDARLTQQEKDRLALEEKKAKAQNDPRNEIINDKSLTQEQKKSALKLLDEAEGSKLNKDIIKYVVIGAIVLMAIVVISKSVKKPK